jgi:GT2 family glycosyltransferase
VRSRHRISALAGRSPTAYALWIARDEPKDQAQFASAGIEDDVGVVPLIDCRGDFSELNATLESLFEAGLPAPILVGRAGSEAGAVDRPSDLAAMLPKSGAWLLSLHAGDRVAPCTAAAYRRAIAQHGDSRLIYADDDLIDCNANRQTPHFKPEWNPELFEHHDFITGSCIVRADATLLASLPDDGWAEALVRRTIERGAAPLHLPLVLHHRRRRPQPVRPSIAPSLPPAANPSVSVIIPTRDRSELLRSCIEGLDRTEYQRCERIIVDNGSSEPQVLAYLAELEQSGTKVLRMPGPFNYSALNNAAVQRASGELLCFLNNDIEMIDADWLRILVAQAVRDEIGAVGARLLYPDGTIQHAGVFTGIGGGAAHAHRFQHSEDVGYFERANLPQRVSAVTGACLVVARDKFLIAGGFDEENFPVAFNDVDLCLKLNSRGWQSFYEPRATLIHHESKSRGSDRLRTNRTRFAAELAALKRIWKTDQFTDPYHHPHLSPFCEQFSIAV